MHHQPHSDSATYWRFYQCLGTLRAHATRTLAHILRLYGPYTSATEAQAALRKRAVAELSRRAAAGREDARQVLREWMGAGRAPRSWEEAAGIDPHTGFPL